MCNSSIKVCTYGFGSSFSLNSSTNSAISDASLILAMQTDVSRQISAAVTSWESMERVRASAKSWMASANFPLSCNSLLLRTQLSREGYRSMALLQSEMASSYLPQRTQASLRPIMWDLLSGSISICQLSQPILSWFIWTCFYLLNQSNINRLSEQHQKTEAVGNCRGGWMLLNRLLSYYKQFLMAFSGKNHRTKWRYIAPKVTPNEAGLNSSIRENRPVKFSPPKSDDSSQDHSFPKRDQFLHEIRMKRCNSLQNTLHEPRQSLRLLNGSPSMTQALTSIMKEDGHLLKRKDYETQGGQANIHGICSCIELKETYNLIRQIKESFLEFQKEILGQIKFYEQMFEEEISKIYQFITQYVNDHKQQRIKTQTLAKIEQEASVISQESYETLRYAQKREMSRLYQTESRLITMEVPQRQRRKVELQACHFKSYANFDRFFEIMQTMRDTLDRRVVSVSQLSIFK